ncbi:2-oxo-4-hydroxy-4-carboxy-5-ureidoimidazoline decarboxylase [Amycolatopsis magusensis]|uniref:2-oxo-4-hydroxy-4-carboxy-5-ureidoimidazoline decarboxylase n=1 Tax=Amycolatopsis magusensis TaxID=882444 RepID=UPI0024A849D2|nr:2-oxo-4-hydroxy-4-carboxy-5-ureidoimidazoline decarboxylase [Amycolatopsis magusensis]MDI5976038.1 2-oxo-4-hydroxy-4-carboxy-5-ureidoimidazoline decarboxylase [Amycolatopsis magusensis]
MTVDLAGFNEATTAEARALLLACLAVPRWADAVLAARPYADRESLLDAAAKAADPLTADEVHLAIADHPRIGEKPATQGASADWSRSEQSGVDDQAAAEFRAANAAYEERFGWVYLVCASGRSGAELLADLRSRMANDPAEEITVAGGELSKIAVLRLGKAVA